MVLYACVPGGGSEKGAGWAVLKGLLAFADCVAVVPDKHVADLEKWASETGSEALTVVGITEGSLGARLQQPRLPLFGAYVLWLHSVRSVLDDLVADHRVDLAWHATYSTYYLPTPLRDLDVPTVWGPIGGAVEPPPSLAPMLPDRTRKTLVAEDAVRSNLARLPSVARSMADVDHVVLQNDETLARVRHHRSAAKPTTMLNHSLGVDIPVTTPDPATGGRVVWIGAMQQRKGPELAVRALEQAPGVKLTMVGGGPVLDDVQALATELGVADRITFTGQVDRTLGLNLVAGASAAIFTGLYEEGGLALAEALLLGTPSVVLAHGGAKTIAEFATDRSRVRLVPVAPLDAMTADLGRAMIAMQAVGRASEPLLDQGAFVSALEAIVHSATMVTRS